MATFGPVFFPPLGPANGASKPSAPQGWDRCTLADKVLPGFSRITKGAIRLKIDKKSKAGADGAYPTCHGLEPQPIELEITTYNDDDREELAGIAAGLIPMAGRTPAPVSIDHPSLRPLGISMVLIVGVSPLMVVKPMRARMTFDLLHWLPPPSKPATKTPKGAPVRKVQNVGPAANVAPHQQAGVGAPPAGLKPT
jgi:hypothetical protein